ncbi:glycosyltransferase [Apibacter raozihei]|uniref:glycosyltransferase family 2 protein n=1 Tax=Apibacter raozihei TaxID=2500547 RepID=UPI000FE42091|nr:cellulose synthase catalytic subunit [Apibacter raozihei]
MRTSLHNDLWKSKNAKNVSKFSRFILLVLTLTGILLMINLGEWWFTEFHVAYTYLFVILSTFFWYEMIRIILIWINYLRIKKPVIVPEPKKGLSVAVFTTSAPGEPISMFENTFKALQNLEYPHTTYLLDSTQDENFKILAEKYKIVFMDLSNIPGAKAGKVNEALKRTQEEFILILDPDHIVFPNFLNQTLGFFEDDNVGFVQVSQGYYNQYRSFVAKGAAEQTYTFYGPTQMGFFGYGGAVAIGANCTFRRKALESIGGHAQGLAEDLQTSLRIHAQGWKSVYNPVIVSRGLVPEDFGSFCKQQLKWARGVFEVLFEDLPQVAGKFTFWQKISYFSIGTYYFCGLTTFFFILVPLLYFFAYIIPANMVFSEFLVKFIPILAIAIIIYAFAQKYLCDPVTERGFHWRGMILKYACWPVFTYAFLLALFNKKIPYIPTAKTAQNQFFTPFVKPLFLYCIFFILGVTLIYIGRRYYLPESELYLTIQETWGMVAFSFIAFLQSILGIMAALEAIFLKEDNPWEKINITNNKIEII